MRLLLTALIAILVSGCASKGPSQEYLQSLAAVAVSNPARSEADRAIDDKRKPAEVLGFFRIEPGMRVLDVFGGGEGILHQLRLVDLIGLIGQVVAQVGHDGFVGAIDAALNALTAAAGSSTYRQVPAALLHLESGRHQAAMDIAAALEQDLRAQYRAYGKMITGMAASRDGDHVAALDALREASGLFDYWLIRFQLGRAYLAAGQFAEATDELAICERRRGEAAAIFLDDLPSWRYVATLPYWQGIAMAGVGMQEAARQKLQAFIDSRTAEDELLADARRRLAE